jgi:hypothetical protein
MNAETILCPCPQCGRSFRIPVNLAGRKVVCKGCQAHFVVPGAKQAATHPPAHAVAAAPAHAAAKTPHATAAAPAAVAHETATDDFAPIPLDDSPLPVPGDSSGSQPLISTRGQKIEKVKIETTGPYYVAKLYLSGKMTHVVIEKALNEMAADGWQLKQVLSVGETEAYAIFYREQDGKMASKQEEG